MHFVYWHLVDQNWVIMLPVLSCSHWWVCEDQKEVQPLISRCTELLVSGQLWVWDEGLCPQNGRVLQVCSEPQKEHLFLASPIPRPLSCLHTPSHHSCQRNRLSPGFLQGKRMLVALWRSVTWRDSGLLCRGLCPPVWAPRLQGEIGGLGREEKWDGSVKAVCKRYKQLLSLLSLK